MVHKDILNKIISDLKKLASDPKNLKDYSKFHKDGKIHIGLTSSLVRKVASEDFKFTKDLEKKQIFFVCEKLLYSGVLGSREIAFDWAFRLRKTYKKDDFKIKIRAFPRSFAALPLLCKMLG